MTDVVLLDSGPLGMICHPRPRHDIAQWLITLVGSGRSVLVPEVADYEVRRELLRAGKKKSLRRLDELKANLGYVAITTEAMLRAAEFWAASRRVGRPTSHEKALDADAILAGQAATLGDAAVMVATSNARHIARFVPARDWQEIVA